MLAPSGPPGQAGRETWVRPKSGSPYLGPGLPMTHLRDHQDAGDVVPGGDVARLIGRVDVVVGALDDMTRTEGVKRIWGRRHGRRPDGRVPRGLRRGRGGRGRGAPRGGRRVARAGPRRRAALAWGGRGRRREPLAWPTIGASVGPGTTAGAGLDPLPGMPGESAGDWAIMGVVPGPHHVSCPGLGPYPLTMQLAPRSSESWSKIPTAVPPPSRGEQQCRI